MLTAQVRHFLEHVWDEAEESTADVTEAVSSVWNDPHQSAGELIIAMDRVLNCEEDESARDELIEDSEQFAVGGLPFCLPVMRVELLKGLQVNFAAAMDVTKRMFQEANLSLRETITIIWSTMRAAPDGSVVELIAVVASRQHVEEQHALRCGAAQAIGKIGVSSDEAVEVLSRVAGAANEPQSLRSYCIEALMDLGPSAANTVPVLESIRKNETEDEDLRNFAWAALKSVGANSTEHPCGGTVAEHMRSLYTSTQSKEQE